MKIARFAAVGLHGHLNIEFCLFPDITFLTGINGSGKTASIYSIVSLLTPSLEILSETTFDSVEIDVEYGDEKITIRAQREGTDTILTASNAPGAFRFAAYDPDPDLSLHRQTELRTAHYAELVQVSSESPVIKAISSLPSPMFLGIDRRARLSDDPVRNHLYLPPSARRRVRNPFNTFNAASINYAVYLAETSQRDSLISIGQEAAETRQQIVLELLRVSVTSLGELTPPSTQEKKEITRLRSDMPAFARALDLPESTIENTISPFLKALEKFVGSAPEASRHKKGQPFGSPEQVNALINWSLNKSQFDKIKAISEIIDKFSVRRAEAMEVSDRYLGLLNNFIANSLKSIIFTDRGYLSLLIDGVVEPQPLTSLSSGESQIFVILSHLMFNPSAQSDNIFIIDEPELSLHIRWQELFVDSVYQANPDIQYIFATHSPSIILGRREHCVHVESTR